MFFYLQKIFFAAVVICLLAACSDSKEEAEKGRIEQGTDKIAQETIKSIKTPLDRAQSAKALTKQHNEAVKNNLNEQ